MINQKEFEICKRRGHQIVVRTGWSQCPACAAWVREVTIIEEREDRPPENEISSAFFSRIYFGLATERKDEEPSNKEELDICHRRGHVLSAASIEGWEQCKQCKIWVREKRTLEERDERPPRDK